MDDTPLPVDSLEEQLSRRVEIMECELEGIFRKFKPKSTESLDVYQCMDLCKRGYVEWRSICSTSFRPVYNKHEGWCRDILDHLLELSSDVSCLDRHRFIEGRFEKQDPSRE